MATTVDGSIPSILARLHGDEKTRLRIGAHQKPVLGPPAIVVVALFQKAHLTARHGFGVGIAALFTRQVTDKAIRFNMHEYIAGLQEIGNDAPTKKEDTSAGVQETLFRIVLRGGNRVAGTPSFHQFRGLDLHGTARPVDDTRHDAPLGAQPGKDVTPRSNQAPGFLVQILKVSGRFAPHALDATKALLHQVDFVANRRLAAVAFIVAGSENVIHLTALDTGNLVTRELLGFGSDKIGWISLRAQVKVETRLEHKSGHGVERCSKGPTILGACMRSNVCNSLACSWLST